MKSEAVWQRSPRMNARASESNNNSLIHRLCRNPSLSVHILRFILRASCPANALATLFPTAVPRSIWVLGNTPSFKMYWNSSGR
jgi:hypothetical protein